MVTLTQLKAQKKRIIDARDRAAQKQKIQFEKIGLQKEIKRLNRSPGALKNIALAKRIGRGFKLGGKKLAAAAIRQAKRIKAQQIRDNAAIANRVTKTSKKIKTGQKLSKIKEGNGFDVFSSLDF